MRIAGFDIATTTGAAVMDAGGVLHAQAFRPAGIDDAEIFTGFRMWLWAFLIEHKVQYAAIEAPLVTDIKAQDKRENAVPGQTRNPVTQKTYLRLYGLRGHAIQIFNWLNIPYEEVHQATWRKAFLGNGRAKKEHAVAQCALMGVKTKSKDACEAVGVCWWLAGELRLANLARPGELFATKESSAA